MLKSVKIATYWQKFFSLWWSDNKKIMFLFNLMNELRFIHGEEQKNFLKAMEWTDIEENMEESMDFFLIKFKDILLYSKQRWKNMLMKLGFFLFCLKKIPSIPFHLHLIIPSIDFIIGQKKAHTHGKITRK